MDRIMISFSEDPDNEKTLATKQGSGLSFVEGLHIFVLFSFAVSQPVFDILSQNPEFLVAHKTTFADLLSAIFAPLLLAPLALVLLQKLLGIFNEELRRRAHLMMVFCLLAIIFNPPLKALPDSLNGLRVLSAVLIAAAGAVAYSRWKSVKTFLTFLSPSILIFPVVFISHGQISEVVSQDSPPPESQPKAVESDRPRSDTPIVILVFDELPLISLLNADGEIDDTRYPHFAALARDSVWYRNATTVSDSSTFAIPALVTGNYPDPQKIPISRHYPDTVFSLFAPSYEVRAFESATLLCPPELQDSTLSEHEPGARRLSLFFDTAFIYMKIALPAKIGKHLPEVSHTWEGFGDPHEWIFNRWLGELASDRLDSLRRFWAAAGSKNQLPSLFFLHLLLPHSPFDFLPNGERYEFPAIHRRGPNQVWDSKEQVVLTYYRHLLQLGFVDRILGETVTILKDSGIYDRSLLCVLSDHGISCRIGDAARRLSRTNASDILFVPLLMKAPGQTEGRVDDRAIQLVDVLPTIAAILQVQIPWPIDGRAASTVSTAGRGGKGVLRSQDRKWISIAPDPLARDLSLKRKIEWFGSGADENRLFYPKLGSTEIDQLTSQIAEMYGIRPRSPNPSTTGQ
jgi:hypothetical protein